MNQKVNTTVLMFGAWAALLYLGLLCIGWWGLAGFIPPLTPTSTAVDVASLFQEHTFRIRAGMVITMFGAMMAMPLGATSAHLISRIEGFVGPVTILQIMGGVGMAVLTFYPPMWWLIASFRPERNPEVTLMLSDASWLQWVGGLSIYYPTIVSMAIAAFIDKSERPAFPRWFGYANIWMVMLLLPGQLVFFFKVGPFAWNGIIAFWLAFSVFALWFPVAFFVLRKAVIDIRIADAPKIADLPNTVAARQPRSAPHEALI